MVSPEPDARIRAAALAYLQTIVERTGGPVRYNDVATFTFEGERIPLMDPQRGIRKPRVLDAALSFRTVHAPRPDLRPYDDAPGEDGYLRYKWRGTDPMHPENIALRRACKRGLPLIWFQGIASGLYLPIYPVWLVSEEPELHQFVVALDASQRRAWEQGEYASNVSRDYASRIVQERLHQPLFRVRVLAAYKHKCALCRLRHLPLLDAAHIRPDSQGGAPVVPNGIAMCKIHHAAFDSFILAVRPDYVVEVRRDVLEESNGPMLRHGLQALDRSEIDVPRSPRARPDASLLEERYEQFRAAG